MSIDYMNWRKVLGPAPCDTPAGETDLIKCGTDFIECPHCGVLYEEFHMCEEIELPL
jgi:hypothetical protein